MLGGAAYGAAKAGVRNLMGLSARNLPQHNIRATTILPGEVNTPIIDDRPRPPTPEERAGRWSTRRRGAGRAPGLHAAGPHGDRATGDRPDENARPVRRYRTGPLVRRARGRWPAKS